MQGMPATQEVPLLYSQKTVHVNMCNHGGSGGSHRSWFVDMEEVDPSALYRCTFGRHLEVEEVPREGVLSGTWTTLICGRRYICISADLCYSWTSCSTPHLDLLAPLPLIILLLRQFP